MLPVTGLPSTMTTLPGVSANAHAAVTADADGATDTGAGPAKDTAAAAGKTAVGGMGPQYQRPEIPPRPDPDAMAGPPPTFEHTPLEKLQYPPSPLQDLMRRMRTAAPQGEDAGAALVGSVPDTVDAPPGTEVDPAPDTSAGAEPARSAAPRGYDAPPQAAGGDAGAGASEPTLNLVR